MRWLKRPASFFKPKKPNWQNLLDSSRNHALSGARTTQNLKRCDRHNRKMRSELPNWRTRSLDLRFDATQRRKLDVILMLPFPRRAPLAIKFERSWPPRARRRRPGRNISIF